MALQRKIFFSLSFLLVSQLLSCAKTPMIFRNGIEMPVEQAASLDYQEGESLFGRKRLKDASVRYRRIVDKMPISSFADNAMLRLAQIQRTQDNPGDAIRLLEALLSKYPRSDVSAVAKEELGRLLFAQKEYARAADIFSAIPWKDVPAASRPGLERTIRATFDRVTMDREKLFWLLSVWDALAEAERNTTRRTEIVDLMDRAASRADLEQIFRSREPAFPAGYACFKLAKIAYHAGKRGEAKEWVTTFLNRFPDHEYSRDAVILSESLVRTEEVDPASIGLLLPLTGTNQVYAAQVLRGVALAVNLYSARKSDTPAATFHIEDVGDDSEMAAAAVDKLVRENKVIVGMGPLFSKESQAAALAALPYGLPLVSLSPAEGITDIGDSVFRNSLTKSEQAAGLAKLAVETLGIRRAAILYPQNNYGVEFMTFFWKEFVARGGEIRGAESYEPDASDFGQPIKKLVALSPLDLRAGELCSETEMNSRLKKTAMGEEVRHCYTPDRLPPIVDFEAIFIPDGFEKVTQIVPALTFYDVRGVQVLGSNLLNSMELFKARGGEAMQGTVLLDGFFKNKKEPPVPDFVGRFYATFGMEPTVIEAQAFDTASILLDVIAKNHPSDRQGFTQALKGVRDFPGVSGATSFFPGRDAHRKLTALTIEGDQLVELN